METNASNLGKGAVLSQEFEDGILHLIAYWSNAYSAAEKNYPVMKKELLAIVKALATWRHHLEGAKHWIKIITDQANLRYYMTKRKVPTLRAFCSTRSWFVHYKVKDSYVLL